MWGAGGSWVWGLVGGLVVGVGVEVGELGVGVGVGVGGVGVGGRGGEVGRSPGGWLGVAIGF